MRSDDLLFSEGATRDEVAGAAHALLSALLESPTLDARRHPLGFIHIACVHRGTPLRVHVWPQHRIVQDTDLLVHDHTFRFRSRVLLGSVRNVVYAVHESPTADKELYHVEYDGPRSALVPTGLRVQLVEKTRTYVTQFGLYEMEAGSFHESLVDVEELGCTVLSTEPASASRARVVGPSAAAAREFERREVEPHEVRSLVELVLARVTPVSPTP